MFDALAAPLVGAAPPDAVAERGFPAARWAEKREEFIRANIQCHIIDGLEGAEPFLDAMHANGAAMGCGRSGVSHRFPVFRPAPELSLPNPPAVLCPAANHGSM